MKDRRKAERVTCLQQLNGMLRLYADQQSYDVRSVGDVSPFEIKVEPHQRAHSPWLVGAKRRSRFGGATGLASEFKSIKSPYG